MTLTLWNESQFVNSLQSRIALCCDPDSADYITPERRFAVFDLDGTLWCEEPHLTELAFLRSELELALHDSRHVAHHNSISSLLNDVEKDVYRLASNYAQMYRLVFAGMNTEEYHAKVLSWVSTARHPRFGLTYAQMVYQPMLELIGYLQDHQFRCVINSGSSAEFVQSFSREIFNISADDVFGSHLNVDLPNVSVLLNIGSQKVKQLEQQQIQPVCVFGNTFGDAEMLQWARTHFAAITALISHDDAIREYDYPFDSLLKLELEIQLRDTHVVSISQDWKQVLLSAAKEDERVREIS